VKDPLLDGASGAILRSPRLELGVMMEEQLGQEASVFGIVLGPAGDEGFAILLEGDGIDGVEGNPGVGFQEGDQMGRGLFQAEGQAGLRVLLAQFQEPFPKSLRGGSDGTAPALAIGRVDEVEVSGAIGAIQTGDQVIRNGVIHREDWLVVNSWASPAGLDRATAI
jgi:hypothetical protein